MKILLKFGSLVVFVSEDLFGWKVIVVILLYDDIEDQFLVVSLGIGIYGYVMYVIYIFVYGII